MILAVLLQFALFCGGNCPQSINTEVWLTVGDSKTVTNQWQPLLVASVLSTKRVITQNIAQSGIGVDVMYGRIDADLADPIRQDSTTDALINLFDIAYADGGQWKLRMGYIADAIHAKYPNGRVFIARPWRRDYLAQANTQAGWTDEIVAARAGWCFVGPDERVWLEGGDDGVTMTTDGTHYSAAGIIEAAAQWQSVLGY